LYIIVGGKMDLIDEFKQRINEFVELKEAGKIDNEKLATLIDVVKQNPALSKTEIAEKVYGSKTRTENVYNLIKKAFELLESENPSQTQEITKEERKIMKEAFKTLILEKAAPYRPVLQELAQQFGEEVLSSYYISQMAITIALQSVDLDVDGARELLKKMYGNKHEFEEWVVQHLTALLEAKRGAQEILKMQAEISELKSFAYEMYKRMVIATYEKERAEYMKNKLMEAFKTAAVLVLDRDVAVRIGAYIDMMLKDAEKYEPPALKELRRLEAIEKQVEEEEKGKEINIEEARKK
jgi:phosphorylcholine metabolism protein LicD